MTIDYVIRHINWALLRDQKMALLLAAEERGSQLLHGVASLIDAIQDAAAAEGYPVVFINEEPDDQS